MSEPNWISKEELEADLLYTLIGKEKNPLEAFKQLLKDQQEGKQNNEWKSSPSE